MPTEIRQRAPQHYESDSVRAWPSSRAQGLEYGERQSIGRRSFHSLFRFIVVVLMGVGFTLAWQSYGDEGVKMVRSNAPSLAWLLPVPKTKTPLNNQMSASAITAEVKQQLEPVALKVDIVQHSIVQLAAKIDELAANQVTNNIQAVGDDISRRTSPLPPSMNAARVPERGSKPDKPGPSTSVGTVPNTADTAEADQPASNKCNIDACKQTYFTFNPADCTYQPLEGPRRLCTK
jgi:hypothetical protein